MLNNPLFGPYFLGMNSLVVDLDNIPPAAAASAGFVSTLGPQMIVSCAENPRQCGGSGGCDGVLVLMMISNA